MIIKVDVKVAGDDEFMICGSGKRKEWIKFIKKNRKKVWRTSLKKLRPYSNKHGKWFAESLYIDVGQAAVSYMWKKLKLPQFQLRL